MLAAVFSLLLSSSAFAHGKDHEKNNHKPHYQGNSGITNAAAVSMIVKGLDLNINHIRFVKQPLASDYFTKVKDNASYAQDFVIAQFSGLDLPKDINPSAKVSREQFAHWLFGAFSHKGDFSWIAMYVEIADAKQISSAYMNSIQKLLLSKIATLDSKQKFNPKNPVTRSSAETMINRAAKFIKENSPVYVPENPVLNNAKLTTEKVTDNISKVTVTVTAPHPGYGIEITGIQFSKGQAVIQYRAVLPNPDMMYPQVLKDISVTTYISSEFTPVLGEAQPAAPFPG
jgi:hypothetical protein